jgi:hypothetical protein
VQVVLENGERTTAYTYFLVKPLEEDKRPSKEILTTAKQYPLKG